MRVVATRMNVTTSELRCKNRSDESQIGVCCREVLSFSTFLPVFLDGTLTVDESVALDRVPLELVACRLG